MGEGEGRGYSVSKCGMCIATIKGCGMRGVLCNERVCCYNEQV